MRMQIKDFALLTGVSVRTLHYYDQIGLLRPAYVDQSNGYRYYDDDALERMQEILFYRELDFSLKSILDMLSCPDYDRQEALSMQRELLVMKKERIERIIAAIDSAGKGKIDMKAFDNSDYQAARAQYQAEAKERWGNTPAYREYEEKSAEYTEDRNNVLGSGMYAIFHRFSLCLNDGDAPESDCAQALVKSLQEYISENYYTCTPDILSGLGQMYVCDERFRKNIDRHKDGTAAFVSSAIAFYCKRTDK